MARLVRRLRRLRLGVLGIAGGVIVLGVIVVAIFAPYLSPYDPQQQDLFHVLQGPTWRHPLGLDDIGRDNLSRIIYGSRVSLRVGIIAVGIAAAWGVTLGLISGYYRGWVDNLIMRVMDAILAFPALVLALGITAALGPSLTNMMIAIGFINIPRFARLVRGQVLSVREEQFVEAARSIGAGHLRIMLRHILPNVLSPVIVLASLGTASAILAEASLSFLGLGIQPPTPAWGSMTSRGLRFLQGAPWASLAPGGAIFITVMGFNLLGDAIRDALDPRLRRA